MLYVNHFGQHSNPLPKSSGHFHDTNKTVEELFSNNSLQFAYYEVNPDRMMGFTAETEYDHPYVISSTNWMVW